jgi:hypothetical protein
LNGEGDIGGSGVVAKQSAGVNEHSAALQSGGARVTRMARLSRSRCAGFRPGRMVRKLAAGTAQDKVCGITSSPGGQRGVHGALLGDPQAPVRGRNSWVVVGKNPQHARQSPLSDTHASEYTHRAAPRRRRSCRACR